LVQLPELDYDVLGQWIGCPFQSHGGQRALEIHVVGMEKSTVSRAHIPSARNEEFLVLWVTLLQTLILEFLVSLEIELREPDVVCNVGQDAWHVHEQV